jgi:hypothetical protein
VIDDEERKTDHEADWDNQCEALCEGKIPPGRARLCGGGGPGVRLNWDHTSGHPSWPCFATCENPEGFVVVLNCRTVA